MPSGLYSIPPPSGVDSLLFLTISGCTFTTGCHVKIIAAPAPYKHYQYAITISISFEYFSLSDKAVHDHQRIEEAYRLAWHMDGCVKVPVIIWVSSYSRQRWTQKSPHSLWNVGFQDITGQCRISKWWRRRQSNLTDITLISFLFFYDSIFFTRNFTRIGRSPSFFFTYTTDRNLAFLLLKVQT